MIKSEANNCIRADQKEDDSDGEIGGFSMVLVLERVACANDRSAGDQ